MGLDPYKLKVAAEKAELILAAIDAVDQATLAIQMVMPDMTNINSVADNLPIIIDVYNNEPNINAVKANEVNINALADITATLESLNTNIESVKSAESNADDSKTFRDQAEEFKNQTEAIAGGDVSSKNVKFLDDKDLETYRTELTKEIDSKVGDFLNKSSVGDIVVTSGNNRALITPVSFSSIKVEDNAVLKLI
jgi:hypothetical protein